MRPRVSVETQASIPDRSLGLARIAVLAVAALLLCREIDAPFDAWHELNDALYTQLARNHIQYGLRQTAFYATWGDTATMPAAPERYLNHPPRG
jgi:hypothetical protein